MDIRSRLEDLNARILKGDIVGAFDDYYADDVAMSENGDSPTTGKAANRVREVAFVESIAEFHSGAAERVIVDGNHSAVEWFMDFTTTDGVRHAERQVAIQTWNDAGLIVREVFYHG